MLLYIREGVLVFCCYVKSYHKLSDFKQQPLVITDYLWIRSVSTAWLGYLLIDSRTECKV